jgi:macrolide transport system ATP-binding/permease protein
MAYAVARRTREIVIRMALGARRSNVFALVLRQGGTFTLAGMIVGVAGAMATGEHRLSW